MQGSALGGRRQMLAIGTFTVRNYIAAAARRTHVSDTTSLNSAFTQG